MRIAAKLAEKIETMAPDERVHILLKARLLEGSILDELIRRHAVKIRQVIRMANVVAVSIAAGQIERLSIEPWVERIEEDAPIYALLDESVELIGAPSVWETGFTGRGVKLAVIDSGIDTAQDDFSERIVAIRDFTLEGFEDSNGHGSLVAGIAAGSGAHSGGTYRGVAPGALILAAKVLNKDGAGRTSDAMAAVEWAVEIGSDIINLSLGSAAPSDGGDLLSELCDQAVERGVIICAAVGNDGPNRRTVGSPAAARRVLAIGAATPNGMVAEFSSRGPTVDDRLKPEVVAPGVDVVSVRAKGTKAGKPLNTHYTSATGTSMATPHVSGLVALLLEAHPGASPQLIREALLHTARDLDLDDYAQGAGMVVAEEALRYVQTHENPPEPIDQSPPRSALLTIIGEMVEARAGSRPRRPRRERPAAAPPDLFDDRADMEL